MKSADLMGLYEVASTATGFAGHPTLDGDQIIVLVRKRNLKGAKSGGKEPSPLYRLADEIWVRGSLLATDNEPTTN